MKTTTVGAAVVGVDEQGEPTVVQEGAAEAVLEAAATVVAAAVATGAAAPATVGAEVEVEVVPAVAAEEAEAEKKPLLQQSEDRLRVVILQQHSATHTARRHLAPSSCAGRQIEHTSSFPQQLGRAHLPSTGLSPRRGLTRQRTF